MEYPGESYISGVLAGIFFSYVLSLFFGDRSSKTVPKRPKKGYALSINLTGDQVTKLMTIVSKQQPRSEEPLPGPKIRVETSDDDEVSEMFSADEVLRSMSRSEILNVGKNAGEEKILFSNSNPGSGYMTLDELENVKKTNETIKSSISRSQELSIISQFRSIVEGKNYYDACNEVERDGYKLHPLYVGRGVKMPAVKYSGTTLGVRISDPSFDSTRKIPSSEAKVTEIIDVGGVDTHNRGITRL